MWYTIPAQHMKIVTEKDYEFFLSLRLNWDWTSKLSPPQPDYQFPWMKKVLKDTCTRELLQMRDVCYSHGGWYGYEGGGPTLNIDLIKEELATREHIPNKKEAKTIRRMKSQTSKRDKGPRRRM